IASGIHALSGPLHGGANQAVLEMLEEIVDDGGDVSKYVAKAKDKEDKFRLMGFGHRVYKNFDPRAKLIKTLSDDVLSQLGLEDPLLDVAKELEQVALEDDYFVERKLYPNVDFYSGIIYRAMGFPTDMFTVLFALGRLPGWLAQWRELQSDPQSKIFRPRQVYSGPEPRDITPLSQRSRDAPLFATAMRAIARNSVAKSSGTRPVSDGGLDRFDVGVAEDGAVDAVDRDQGAAVGGLGG